jgi:two-component system, sensor histidine kinase RegB
MMACLRLEDCMAELLANPAFAPPPELTPSVRVRLRTLVFVRWLAVAGQAAALLTVHFWLGHELPLHPTLAAVTASGLLNLALTIYRPAARLGDRAAAVLLGWDLVQLAALLYFTGGLTNPFALLLLAPVTVSATILSRRSTVLLCLLGIALATGLASWHQKLPWPAPGLDFPGLYVSGLWTALTLGAIFLAAYVSSVATEARQMSDALAATQMALAREQRLSALGALAAAAAHELGSPLGTIAVIAREIAHDLPKDSEFAADAALLLKETARCRDILARLAARPEDDGATPFARPPLSALLEAAAAPYARPGIAIGVHRLGEASAQEPAVPSLPELIHGLGNLIQNAVQFARSRVEIDLAWDERRVSVTVADDGPGFPTAIIDRLGEPYLSTRSAEGDHMGLGVFIACTLLERTGAQLEFANRANGGASVQVRWPRARLEGGPA